VLKALVSALRNESAIGDGRMGPRRFHKGSSSMARALRLNG
jgi:hypothetical protein